MKNRCIKNLILFVLLLVSSFAVTSVAYAMGNVVREGEEGEGETTEYYYEPSLGAQGLDESDDTESTINTPDSNSISITESPTLSPPEETTEATTVAPKQQNNDAKTKKGEDKKEAGDSGKVIEKPKTVTNSVEVSKEIGDTLRVFFYSDAEDLEVSCDLDGIPLTLQPPIVKWSNKGKNRICFVIDTKSSISQEKWEKIKAQIIQIQSKELLKNDSISIITTDKNGVLDGSEQVEYTNVIPDTDKLTVRLDEINFDNETTNINKSLINVGEYLDVTTDDDTRSVIIAISDGMIDPETTDSLKGRLTIYETPMYFVDAGDGNDNSPKPLAESTTDGKTLDVSETSVTDLYKHLTECNTAEFNLDPNRENAVYEMAFNFNTGSDELETFKGYISLMGNKIYEDPDDTEEDATPGDATPGNAQGGEVTTEGPGNPGGPTKPPVKSGESENSRKKIIVIILIAIFVLIMAMVIAIIVWKRKSKTVFKKEENFTQNSLREGPALKNTNIGIPIIIEVTNGDNVTKEIHINVDGSLIVGSSEISDLKIDEPSMSKQHFVLEYDGMDFFIMDLESKNGTFLNGEKINGKRKLEKTDKIKASVLDIAVRW